MIEGVDYSFSRPSPQALKAAGKQFAVRYIGTPSSGKNLTKAEADALQAAGLALVSNYEAGQAGWMQGGRQVGVDAAKGAHKDAVACGMPPTRPIYFSADFNATFDQYKNQIKPCLEGAGTVLGGPGRVGVYGSVFVVTWAMQDGVADWGWGTYAWSFGEWPPKAQLHQYKNGVQLAGGIVDLDRALAADFGQWGTGDDMSAEDVSAINAHTDEKFAALTRALTVVGTTGLAETTEKLYGHAKGAHTDTAAILTTLNGLKIEVDVTKLTPDQLTLIGSVMAGKAVITGLQAQSDGIFTVTFAPAP